MFTGIVECVSEIRSIHRKQGFVQLSLAVPVDLGESKIGDSFCVQGTCLTAVELDAHSLRVEVSQETLQRTTLGSLSPGSPVNLERALRLSDPLGGHLVTGHVDGIGRLMEKRNEGLNVGLRFQADPKTARYLVEKGSICIDGISLTLGESEQDMFWVYLIPHTLEKTTLKFLRPGAPVNLEADIIGKYIERFLVNRGLVPDSSKGLGKEFLQQHGFVPESEK